MRAHRHVASSRLAYHPLVSPGGAPDRKAPPLRKPDAHAARSPLTKGCEIERIFDQSPRGNHLDKVQVDPHNNPHQKPIRGVDPMSEELTIDGHVRKRRLRMVSFRAPMQISWKRRWPA